MAEQGYKPNIYARGMLGETQTTIGLVIPNVMDPFFSTVISSIEKVCRSESARLLIAEGKTSLESELEAINYLLNRGCDRLLVHCKALSDEQLGVVMKKAPEIFLLNRALAEFEGRYVSFGNYQGGRLAAKALIEKGRRQIAVVSNESGIEDAIERLRGFKDEMAAQGVSFDDSALFLSEGNHRGGMVSARSLLTRGLKFDGVFCYNDMMAAGVMLALHDNGIDVPSEVSVIGFDDLEIASYLVPRLSTVKYPVAEMAEKTTHAILQDLNGDGSALASLNNFWQPMFVSRESH